MGFDYEKSNQLAASQQVYQDNNPTNLYDSRQRSRTTLLANRSDNFGGGGVSTAMYEHEANAQLRGMTPRQLDSPRTPRSKDPILPVKNTKIPNSYFAQFQGNLLGKQEDMQFAERFPTDPSIPEAGQTRDQFFRDWLKISLMRLNNEADPQISTHSGATAIICVRFGDTLYVESLGQCRAYLLNKDGIKQVSVTHQSIAGVNPGEAKRYFTQERYTRSLGNESWTANHPHRITGLSHESESTKYALLGNETLVLATDGAAEPLTSTEIHQSCYLANQTLTPDQQTFCLMKAVVTRLPKDDATVQVSELTQEEAIDVYAIFDGSGPLGQEFARNASEALSGVLAEVKASLIQRNALQNKCVALAADEQKKDRASQVLALLAKIDMTKTKSAMKFMADLEKMLGDENELLNFYTAYGLHAISNLNVAKNMLIQDLNRAAKTLKQKPLDDLMRIFIQNMKNGLEMEQDLDHIKQAAMFWGEIKKMHKEYDYTNQFYSKYRLSFNNTAHKYYAAKLIVLLLCCGAILFAPYTLAVLGAIAAVVALIAVAWLTESHYRKMYSPLWQVKQCVNAANHAAKYYSLGNGDEAAQKVVSERKESRMPLLV